jgi:hypothetical protein
VWIYFLWLTRDKHINVNKVVKQKEEAFYCSKAIFHSVQGCPDRNVGAFCFYSVEEFPAFPRLALHDYEYLLNVS